MGKQLTVASMPDELQGIHVKLAQAIAQDPRQLTKAEKLALLAEIADVKPEQISTRYLATLEARPDFQAAVLSFRTSFTDLSRSLIDGMLPDAAALRLEAIRQMKRRLDEGNVDAADLRLIPALTDPLLERAWPKKSDAAVAAVAVNITLSPRQAEQLAQPQYTVEAELLDPADGGPV